MEDGVEVNGEGKFTFFPVVFNDKIYLFCNLSSIEPLVLIADLEMLTFYKIELDKKPIDTWVYPSVIGTS